MGESLNMNRKVNLTMALAAGLFGGLLSRYVTPSPVYAQFQNFAPKEVRSQSFVLVNKQGATLGRIGFDRDGKPNITLFDENGKIIWSTSERLVLQTRK